MLFFKLIFKELFHLLRTPANRTFLYLAWRYGSKKRYQTTHIKCMNYSLQVPDVLSFIWQFKEIFAEESYRFEANKTKPLIYDCGANIGMSLLYFKKLYPDAQIKAFEADTQIAEILKENLIHNHIQDIHIISKGVWIDDKGIEISLEGADGASIFGASSKTKIESIRLRDFLIEENEVDMLKMDIEGAETAVLMDCVDVLHKVRHIFVEYHAYLNASQSLSEILQLFEANQFRYFIWNPLQRLSPLVNHQYKNNQVMDLQLNIFAYNTNRASIY